MIGYDWEMLPVLFPIKWFQLFNFVVTVGRWLVGFWQGRYQSISHCMIIVHQMNNLDNWKVDPTELVEPKDLKMIKSKSYTIYLWDYNGSPSDSPTLMYCWPKFDSNWIWYWLEWYSYSLLDWIILSLHHWINHHHIPQGFFFFVKPLPQWDLITPPCTLISSGPDSNWALQRGLDHITV